MSTTRSARALLALLAAAALALPATPAVLAQAPPANDDFDAATVVPGLPYQASQDTTEATTAADDPECAGNGHTVWYSFTPAVDLVVTANTFGSDYDTTLSAYTGTRGALEQIACNDDSGSLQSKISFAASSGTTYHLMVGSFFDSSGGQLSLSVAELPAATNDDFDDATVIATLPFDDHISTLDATVAADDPDCFGNADSVWYRLTPAENGTIQAQTFGSNYDTTLSVWTGTRGSLEGVVCRDNPFDAERVRFEATAGVTYFFMVGSGRETTGGSELVFNVRALPPPLVLGLTIDPTGSVSRSGVATVHGTLTCSRDASGVFLLGTIRQKAGKKVAVATFSAEADCSGSAGWSASVAGETAAFRRGDAQVTVSTSYFDQEREEVVRAQASRTVRLQ